MANDIDCRESREDGGLEGWSSLSFGAHLEGIPRFASPCGNRLLRHLACKARTQRLLGIVP
jgi:hypothetical protein